ncbi:MAG: SRPBCC family protein [Kofleriaceae bacterium]|nr:SRPBCC family protein [Kofleriaceae bacterium]
MHTVRAVVPRDPDRCWRAFVDATSLAAWVPGLRRARVILVSDVGLPEEILFEFGESLTYSLVYTYDAANREVRWQPRAGKRDAVAGFAKFEADEGGTSITYSLEHGDGRSDAQRALGDQALLLDAFSRWLQATTKP